MIILLGLVKNGNLDIVKYLLTSSGNLNKHLNIHARNDYWFRFACEAGHLDIVQYLIFDCTIEKTKDIKNFLNENKNIPYVMDAEEMFLARDLKENLSNSLSGVLNKGKIKIKL